MEYLQEEKFRNPESQIITERIYQKNVHNSISYDKKEENLQNQEKVVQTEKKKTTMYNKKIDPYEAYKQSQRPVYGQYRKKKEKYIKTDEVIDDKYIAYKREKNKEQENMVVEEQKNQILNFMNH